jgi:hypothetical protein
MPRRLKKEKNTMNDDDEIMTAEEFFGGIESDRGLGSMSSPRRRRGRTKKTFADIKARMVMRIYGVTREKAEKIVSERAAEKAEVGAAADPDMAASDRGSDDVELMSAEDFFRG